MRAVVIGGSGFVGRRVAEMIAGEPHPGHPTFDSVHVVDRAPFPGARDRITSEIGDVCSRDDLRRALAGAHTVFHLASLVDVGLTRNPRIDAVNVEGTRNVVEVCRELGVPYLVYTSSEDVVLGTEPVVLGDESIPYPTEPVHDYVRTKIEGERIALGANDGRLHTCAIRPVHVYGPRDPHAIVTGLRELASGRVRVLIGDAAARFDIVYVDNVAHAHLLAAARLHDPASRPGVAGRAYFVGEGQAPGFFEFLRPYAEAKGIVIPRRRLPRRVAFAIARAMEWGHRITGREPPFHRFHLYVMGQDFFFTHERASRELGYAPIVTPSEGLRRTLEWLETVPIGAGAR